MYMKLIILLMAHASVSLKPKTEQKIKVIIIGNSQVGKTGLMRRYVEDHYDASSTTTIGVDLMIKGTVVCDVPVTLNIWDTAGQERFRTITTSYYRGADAIMLVYDVCDENSFQEVSNWMKDVHKYTGGDVCMVLVGNKMDDTKNRTVTLNAGQALAEKFAVPFFETSSKTNTGVTHAFEKMVKGVLTKRHLLDTPHVADSDKKPLLLGKAGGNKPSTDSACCSLV